MGGWVVESALASRKQIVGEYSCRTLFFFHFINNTFSILFCIDIGLLVSDMKLYEETGNFNQ